MNCGVNFTSLHRLHIDHFIMYPIDHLLCLYILLIVLQFVSHASCPWSPAVIWFNVILQFYLFAKLLQLASLHKSATIISVQYMSQNHSVLVHIMDYEMFYYLNSICSSQWVYVCGVCNHLVPRPSHWNSVWVEMRQKAWEWSCVYTRRLLSTHLYF